MSDFHLPGQAKLPLYKQREPRVIGEFVGTIVGSAATLFSAFLTGIEAQWSDQASITFALGSGTIVWALVSGIYEWWVARQEDADAREQTGPRDLVGCLEVAHATMSALSEAESPLLRVTVHKHLPDEQKILQLLDYVGGKDGADRTFSDRSGIVGHAIVREKPVLMHRPEGNSFDEYIHELQHTWGMPANEAQTLTRDRMSFMAVPLIREDQVAGVLYADAAEVDFFASAEMQSLVLSIAMGIVKYVDERYT